MRNAEIKAEVTDEQLSRMWGLVRDYSVEVTRDHQIDIYYKVPRGRLKLRLGDVENYLVYYERREVKGQKTSRYSLVRLEPHQRESVRSLMGMAFDELTRVDKVRHIFYIGTTKFHIDSVEGLPGRNFAEIEVRDESEAVPVDELHSQLTDWMEMLGISADQCIDKSYADLVSQAA